MTKDSFSKKHPIIFAVLLLILFLIVGNLAAAAILLLGIDDTSSYGQFIMTLFAEIICIIVLLIVAWKTELLDDSYFSKRNLKLGLFLILPIVILGVVFNILPDLIDNHVSFQINIILIFLALISSLSVGFCEEILCRGLMFKNFLNSYSASKKGIYTAIIISSVIFGLMHLTNIGSDSMDAIIQQVFHSFCAGLMFCAIYLVTENLLVCAIGHGLFDFTSDVTVGLYTTSYTMPANLELISTIIISIILIICTLVIIRKFNIEKSELLRG